MLWKYFQIYWTIIASLRPLNNLEKTMQIANKKWLHWASYTTYSYKQYFYNKYVNEIRFVGGFFFFSRNEIEHYQLWMSAMRDAKAITNAILSNVMKSMHACCWVTKDTILFMASSFKFIQTDRITQFKRKKLNEFESVVDRVWSVCAICYLAPFDAIDSNFSYLSVSLWFLVILLKWTWTLQLVQAAIIEQFKRVTRINCLSLLTFQWL